MNRRITLTLHGVLEAVAALEARGFAWSPTTKLYPLTDTCIAWNEL